MSSLYGQLPNKTSAAFLRVLFHLTFIGFPQTLRRNSLETAMYMLSEVSVIIHFLKKHVCVTWSDPQLQRLNNFEDPWGHTPKNTCCCDF